MGTARFHRGFYCFIKFSLMRTSSPAAVSLPFICTHHHAAGTFKAVLVPTPSSLFPLNYSEPSFYFHALIQVPRRKYLLLLSYRLPRPPWLVSSLISLQLLPAPESPALLSPPKQGSDSSCGDPSLTCLLNRCRTAGHSNNPRLSRTYCPHSSPQALTP